MPLPALDADGRLPAAPGPYLCDLSELQSRFVDEAPNMELRRGLFAALLIWLEIARDVFGPGRVWINGGFVTHKSDPPTDLDLTYVPDDPDHANAALTTGEGLQLVTLQGVLFTAPAPGGSTKRLQPVGGRVDAFLADPRDVSQLRGWHRLWSSVKGPDGAILVGQSKGFVEVIVP